MAANPSCLSNRQNSQNLLQPAPSPVGEGWGEGILPIAAIFPNTLTAPIQALRLAALSLALSHGREDGLLFGLMVLQGKQVVQAAFLFFRRPKVNGCRSKLLFKPPATVKPAAIRSLPRGGGLGRGYSPNCGNLSQHLTAQIQALRLVALSLALSRGREDGVAVRVKQAVARIVGYGRYTRTRSPFSLQPQPTACVPCGTHPTDGFKGRLKKRSRRLFHLPCDKGCLKIPAVDISGILFQTTCNA